MINEWKNKKVPPFIRYNGLSEPCDTIDGPCCCGAWHSIEEWESILKSEVEKIGGRDYGET
jgi:hypothetical protein